jgi:hypothetical protein
MRRWAAAGLAVIVVTVISPLAGAQEVPGSSQPALTVESERVELGTVIAGEDAIATFIFRNHSDQDVNIIRAKPS